MAPRGAAHTARRRLTPAGASSPSSRAQQRPRGSRCNRRPRRPPRPLGSNGPSYEGVDMSPSRQTALIAGIWFALTFIASIPALILYDPVLNDVNYILGAGDDTRIELGALLEIVLAL